MGGFPGDGILGGLNKALKARGRDIKNRFGAGGGGSDTSAATGGGTDPNQTEGAPGQSQRPQQQGKPQRQQRYIPPPDVGDPGASGVAGQVRDAMSTGEDERTTQRRANRGSSGR